MRHSDEYLQRQLEALEQLIPATGDRMSYRARLRLRRIAHEAVQTLSERNRKTLEYRQARAQKRAAAGGIAAAAA